LWGLYARANLALNNASTNMHIADYTSYVFGSDLNWRRLRLGGEYGIYDSTLSSYNVSRLFESYNFHLDSASTLGLDFSQSWSDYISAHRHEQDYRFLVHFHRPLSHQLRLDVQGGYDLRAGPGVDQNLAMFRADLEYTVGKVSVRVGYDFEHDVYLDTEFRDRHWFTVRARRVF
jgi:hypothetical protein